MVRRVTEGFPNDVTDKQVEAVRAEVLEPARTLVGDIVFFWVAEEE